MITSEPYTEVFTIRNELLLLFIRHIVFSRITHRVVFQQKIFPLCRVQNIYYVIIRHLGAADTTDL